MRHVLASDLALRFSAPREYAKALRNAHDATLSGTPDPAFTPSLLESWKRSLALGINPEQHRPIHRHEVAEARALGREHRLATVVPALTQLLADESAAGRHLLIVTDHQGEVLWRLGSASALRQADSLEFVEGADWSEAGIGTNAISEALITGDAAQLFSAEHLVRTHHEWACTAAPIRDPFTGELLGVLDVSGPIDSVTPDSMRMVRCGVRLAEELLRSAGAVAGGPAAAVGTAGRAGRPGSTLFLRLLGDKPTAELDGGRKVPVTLRRAEILALLASRSQGWSAEELAYQLHGEDGAAATIRTEMHRIRASLGQLVEANPYRFAEAVKVVSDAGLVAEHLRAGRIHDAVAAYTGRLLNRSTTLAVELMRDELDQAVASSVRSSGDPELLAQWCSTDMGQGDSEAALAMARLAVPGDPRFQLARARLERLNRELGS
ncbi:helix-turn-helix domain-containing protein [Arthrobacter silvisoli]|uniref:helix-turn-helix domain-containing protein n=1 Tax=Arthrobacter silvisoli TaxID=2291022 RepID=UPI000E217C4A|nr:GAF domain-containing protein [Arthrobacter silvisoli]